MTKQIVVSANLQGLRILNTRPLMQAQKLNSIIAAAGGNVINCPGLAIEGMTFTLPNLETVNYAIFTSSNAVKYCSEYLRQCNIAWPIEIKVIAIGQATASALHQSNIDVAFIPNEACSESLINLDPLYQIENKVILLLTGAGGRQLIAPILRDRNAIVFEKPVYKRTLPTTCSQPYIQSIWQEKAVDIILFTSQQAMQNIFMLFGKPAQNWLRNTPCIVISQRLAHIAACLGIRKIIVCKFDSIIEALHNFNLYSGLNQGLMHGK